MANTGLSIAGIAVAAGIALAGFFGSQTIVNGRVAVNTATVKGLAERVVPADTANWTIRYDAATRGTAPPDAAALFAEAEAKHAAVLGVLDAAGFDAAEITPAPMQFTETENRDYEGRYLDTTYRVAGSVQVRTGALDKTREAYFSMAELPRQGVLISLEAPQYLFTRLNDIKPEMLREATANARIAAEEFARDAGVAVGGIQSATQGGFSVRDAGTDAYVETRTLEKNVRVVTTITFYLDN